MKRKLCMVMAAMLAVAAMPVYAAEDFLVDVPHTFTAKVGTTEFRKDGEAQPLDVPVYIKDGYTMLPLRTFMTAAMAEWAKMEWDGKTGTATVLHGYHIFTFDVKNNKIMKNGEGIPVYGKMEIRDGRVFVPLRNWGNILQALGYIVEEGDITWDNTAKLATIHAVEQKLDLSNGLEKPVISGEGQEAEFALEMTTVYDELENTGGGHFIAQKYPEENVGLGHTMSRPDNIYFLLNMKTGKVQSYQEGISFEDLGEGYVLLKHRGDENRIDCIKKNDGMTVTFLPSDLVESMSEEMMRIEEDGKYGYYQLKGKTRIEPQYEEADDFSEGLAAVCMKDEGEWKVVNGVPERVRYIEWGYIDKTGKMAFDEKYRNAEPFYEGLARVRTEDGYGYIDKKGDVVIPCQYKWGGYFRDGVTYVTDYENQTWLIDKTGEKLKLIAEGKSVLYADDRTEDVNEPKNGILYMEQIVDTPDGDHAHVHTYFNESGRISYQEYMLKKGLSEGLAPFMEEETKKYGYVDEDGKWVITPCFDEAEPFEDGYAIVANEITLADGTEDVEWGIIKHPER